MTPRWWVGVCECVCAWDSCLAVPVELGRGVTTEVGTQDPSLGPPSPLPRPLIWFVSSPSWRTPGQKFAAVQHLGKSSPIPLFTYGRLNWAWSGGPGSGVGGFWRLRCI